MASNLNEKKIDKYGYMICRGRRQTMYPDFPKWKGKGGSNSERGKLWEKLDEQKRNCWLLSEFKTWEEAKQAQISLEILELEEEVLEHLIQEELVRQQVKKARDDPPDQVSDQVSGKSETKKDDKESDSEEESDDEQEMEEERIVEENLMRLRKEEEKMVDSIKAEQELMDQMRGAAKKIAFGMAVDQRVVVAKPKWDYPPIKPLMEKD